VKILSMTATFGCLDGAVLRLEDGLNAIVLPNESGKSTWAAFLLAMFYGIDTAERSARGRMAVKTKYQPWNGKPMEGTVELEHRGRRIVLQRTSQRGKPMSVVRAYDKDTGLTLDEVTAENCGVYFLGVERSVYQRSAFLSGEELTVTADEALSRRLENLAVAGHVSDNYPAASAKLKLWKNRCRYHQNGLIPEAEEKLRHTQETLAMVSDLRKRRLEATAAWEQRKAEVQQREAALEQQWKDEKAAAAADLAEAAARAEQTAARAGGLPSEEALLTLLAKAEQPVRAELPEPPCPPALQGLSAEAILPKVQRDVAEYDRLMKAKKRPWWLCLVLAGLLAAAALLWSGWIALSAVLPVGLFAYGTRRNRSIYDHYAAANGILEAYGTETKDAMLDAAMDRRDWLMARQQAQRQSWETELLQEEVRAFAPQAADLSEAIQTALKRRRQAAEAALELERLQLQWQAVTRAHDPSLAAEKEKAAALHLQAETLRSQEEALGGWEKLEAKRQRLERELETLHEKEAALDLAQAALDAAHDQLEQVYAPRLTALAGEYLRKLTLDRYDALIMGKNLELLVRETDTALTRPLAALSSGTRDQIWLSLRLAMTDLLLPAQAPILLDDALLTFDDARTKAAMEVLRTGERQIVLFTCK